ncbi:MAG: hypothetical protein Q8K99_04300 [Actinomycetota bacterium]|nr:hypothetical protein [Actinomycetota bacterium]
MEGRDSDTDEGVEGIRALYEAKVAAELALADSRAPGSDVIAWSGDVLASVMLVKGLPGPAEATGGAALSGADGAAADKALEALGHGSARVFRMLSRPESGIDFAARAQRLRGALEAVDPGLAIALDAEAAEDLAAVLGLARSRFGTAEHVMGRTFVAVDGLEASLADGVRKKRVWKQFQAATAPGPVY